MITLSTTIACIAMALIAGIGVGVHLAAIATELIGKRDKTEGEE